MKKSPALTLPKPTTAAKLLERKSTGEGVKTGSSALPSPTQPLAVGSVPCAVPPGAIILSDATVPWMPSHQVPSFHRDRPRSYSPRRLRDTAGVQQESNHPATSRLAGSR